MSLHIAMSADAEFVRNFFELAEEKLDTKVRRITLVHNNAANYKDVELLEDFDKLGFQNVEFVRFKDVDWELIDLYLYRDNLENLKFLMAATAQSVFAIDLSGFSATLDQTPVVIPGIDEVQLEEVQEKRMCALPHPQVSQLLYILDPLRRLQQLLYVSVTNVLPANYAGGDEMMETLGVQTRNFFNFVENKEDFTLAFNSQTLGDIAPQKQISFEAQIRRLVPEIDTVSVHNALVPVFDGTMQMVTVGLTTGNTIDQGFVDEWFGTCKDYDFLQYQAGKYSTRHMLESADILDPVMVDFGQVSNTENVKWTSFAINTNLLVKQTVALINSLLRENVLEN